jgi:hypothetical protein
LLKCDPSDAVKLLVLISNKVSAIDTRLLLDFIWTQL